MNERKRSGKVASEHVSRMSQLPFRLDVLALCAWQGPWFDEVEGIVERERPQRAYVYVPPTADST